MRVAFSALAACFLQLAAAEPVATIDAGLEATVIALRDALQRVARERAVTPVPAVDRIDELLAAARRDPAQAQAHLQEAYALVRSEIGRLGSPAAAGAAAAAPAGPHDDPARAAFERKRASAAALSEAFTRIAAESKDSAAQRLAADIARRLPLADARAGAGDWGAATQAVDQVMELAKGGIRGLREGTTQVRSLAFASPAEEYRYELDRHASYRMLLAMHVGSDSAGGVPEKLHAADERLRQAELHAGRGEFTQAVKLMEEATEELQRVLRAAGIFLPG